VDLGFLGASASAASLWLQPQVVARSRPRTYLRGEGATNHISQSSRRCWVVGMLGSSGSRVRSRRSSGGTRTTLRGTLGAVPNGAAMGDSYAVAVRTVCRMPISDRYRTDQCKAFAGSAGYFLFQS
jgi:hypothetical protein